MSRDHESPVLDDVTYFSAIHPAVTDDLAGLSRSFRLLKALPDSAADAAALLAAANRLLGQAYVIFKQPPPVTAPDSIVDFVSALRGLIEFLQTRPDGLARLCRSALAVHMDYYQTHDPDPANATLSAPSYALDLIVNGVAVLSNTLFSHYRWRSEDPRQTRRFFDTASAERAASDKARSMILGLPHELEGWCSNDKAFMLYELVREAKPQTAVEIGIFGGRSIVPIALALKDNKVGSVLGIETWSAAASTKYRTNIGNDFAWSVADYAAVKRTFLRYVLDHGLDDVIGLVEASSDRAHLLLDTIDFIHIDGGHSCFGAAQDIVNYVPKVRQGGIIVFDDIDWATTGPALEILLDTCRLLYVVESMGNAGVPGCAAFVKL